MFGEHDAAAGKQLTLIYVGQLMISKNEGSKALSSPRRTISTILSRLDDKDKTDFSTCNLVLLPWMRK